MNQINVLFVCLGNICRSPSAEGVFRARVRQRGLEDKIHIDSAGTGDWHIGKSADARAMEVAMERGYDLSDLRARQAAAEDFHRFDYILAMDRANLTDLQELAPQDYHGHLGLFLDFSGQSEYREVPDPYYGGAQGFELVLDLIEDACDGLVEHILEHHG